MRLLCDEMLRGLARWLRAAGYDTALASSGTPDSALVRLCAEQGRVLLTRDRALAALAAARRVPVLALGEAGEEETARHLAAALGIDWLHAPFTRCLVDNGKLRPASAEEAARIPSRARALALGGEVRACPVCGRLYWPGSHVRRMQARLSAWAGARHPNGASPGEGGASGGA